MVARSSTFEGGPVADVVALPAGAFWSGSNRYYPEEAPRHVRSVSAFSIARSPVTNDAFAEFVADTGHVTGAERVGSSLVFVPSRSAAGDMLDCWVRVEGASWRVPDGANEVDAERGRHPVVQINHGDALAYASWAGLRLPTEAEWEYAAHRGRHDEDGPDEVSNTDSPRTANIWLHGYPGARDDELAPWGTSEIGRYPANAIGLLDMIGNVWEWCSDEYASSHRGGCCVPTTGPEAAADTPRVIKGGSHLCSPAYCQRYRPSARQPQSEGGSTNHIGFRLARTSEQSARC